MLLLLAAGFYFLEKFLHLINIINSLNQHTYVYRQKTYWVLTDTFSASRIKFRVH